MRRILKDLCYLGHACTHLLSLSPAPSLPLLSLPTTLPNLAPTNFSLPDPPDVPGATAGLKAAIGAGPLSGVPPCRGTGDEPAAPPAGAAAMSRGMRAWAVGRQYAEVTMRPSQNGQYMAMNDYTMRAVMAPSSRTRRDAWGRDKGKRRKKLRQDGNNDKVDELRYKGRGLPSTLYPPPSTSTLYPAPSDLYPLPSSLFPLPSAVYRLP